MICAFTVFLSNAKFATDPHQNYDGFSSVNTSKSKSGLVSKTKSGGSHAILPAASTSRAATSHTATSHSATSCAATSRATSHATSRATSRATTCVATSRTTASSNAVVVAVENNVVTKKEPTSDDNMSCGFLEEDETEERDAALSSPIKGKKRLTNAVSHMPYCHTVLTTQQGIVKIEDASQPPKRVAAARPTNADLPPGCLDVARWRRVFMTTYLQYLGGQDTDNAWIIKDKDAVLLMQCVWDYMYGATVLHTVKVGGPVFHVVSLSFLFC